MKNLCKRAPYRALYAPLILELTPCKIQAFPPNFLVRKFSVNGKFLHTFGQFPESLIIRKLVGKACILRGVTLNFMTQLKKVSGLKFSIFATQHIR